MNIEDMTLDIVQQIEVKGAIADVFQGVLRQFGEANTNRDGESLNLKLEPWPGGRWYRDRGNGIGHLWGHVQVIKPPVLLEMSGPLFMSYPAVNHIEFRLEEITGATKVTLRHRAIGFLDPAHKEGVSEGWRHGLEKLKKSFS